MITLCNPAPGLTCFGCCPPIRPARYDHLDYVNMLRREFSDNRRILREQGPRYRPIVGYSCWALGFVNETGTEVGCLLHPCRNGGRDLRGLIDYGNKCDRESCVPAKVFQSLPPDGQAYWLPLAEGLSPFLFSSARANPLFHLLHWGAGVLEPLRAHARAYDWTVTELVCRQPFLLDRNLEPKASRYLFRLALESVPPAGDGSRDLRGFYEKALPHLSTLANAESDAAAGPPSMDEMYTHLLPMKDDFLDFLRLYLGWRKISLQRAIEIAAHVERMTR